MTPADSVRELVTSGSLKRTGLQRMGCPDCGRGAYVTVPQAERRELPGCLDCGLLMLPDHLELACAVCTDEELERHGGYQAYLARVGGVHQGQKGHAGEHGARWAKFLAGKRDSPYLASPDTIAFERTTVELARDRAAKRVSGLRQNAARRAALAEMPF